MNILKNLLGGKSAPAATQAAAQPEENDPVKKIVAKMLNEGVSLSDIQKRLREEHKINMTFLDLRMLAADLSTVDWSKQNKPEPKKEETPKAAEADLLDEDELDDESAGASSTKVELSRLVRPGALANGSVKFGSGAKADWVLDQYGRLGLENPVGKPTPQDLKEFQAELQRLISRGA